MSLGMTTKGSLIAVLVTALLLTSAVESPQVPTPRYAEEGDWDAKLNRILGSIEAFLRTAISSTMTLSRLLYCAMGIIGATLWTSRLDRLLGRDLIIGAVTLAFIAELIMPMVL